MKSIMEEASTIFKAIEKAWLRADKPQSFSVKVLEEPEKNFFGMTTKSAKIALLFEENSIILPAKPKAAAAPQAKKPSAPQQQAKEPNKRREQHNPNAQQPRLSEQQSNQATSQKEQRPARVEKKPEQQRQAPKDETNPSITWSPQISEAAQKWMQGMVGSLNTDISFTSMVKNNQLIFEFNKPLVENGRDRMLFSSIAHLMMQSIRHEFKNQTRGLKVILKLQN